MRAKNSQEYREKLARKMSTGIQMRRGTKFYKGAPVPVWEYDEAGQNFSVSVMVSLERKEFFFTDGHGFRQTEKLPGNDWVPMSTVIPFHAAPRPGLEDGVVDTIEKMVLVHHKGETFIPDVYEKFHIPRRV